MPLLLKRRSVLDLLNTNSDGDDRPRTSSLLPDPPRPGSPRPTSEYGYSRSRLSHEVQRNDLPDPLAGEEQNGRVKRFSMLKFRNFSESHLAARAKEEEKRDREKENAPPVPAVPAAPSVPAIVKTAPTMDHAEHEQQEEEAERRSRPSLFKRPTSKGQSPSKRSLSKREPRKSTDEKRVEKPKHSLRWRRLQGRSTGLEDLQRLSMMHVASNQAAPPSYGDESNSALALPVPGHRFSESSRSDGSNGSSDQIYGSTTTTTHTVSTHTTFFRLPRRNKNRNSLFPLPVKIPPPHEGSQQQQQDEPTTPRASTSAFSARSFSNTPNGRSPPATILPRRHTESSPTKRRDQQQPPLPTNAVLPKQSLSFAEPGMNLFRNESQRSRNSSSTSPLHPPTRLGMRERASTTSSFGRASHDMGTPPPLTGSSRNSTSTTGRSSLGGFLNLSRFRQSSDPHSPRRGSPGTNSKSSFAMSREALVVPEREEGDTPVKYLERLEAAVARSMIAGILSKSAEAFAQAVLRSYTRRFKFFGEPIDMSLRKFLLEAELPKETQQVDRVVQAFADRYHECNPGIFVSSDQAYIIAFSLMMLHTDAFNKNNKRKMQKSDYIKNTSGQQVSDDVLGCFYDNICYTQFVHYEEEVDINGERVLPFKPKKSKLKGAISESGKKPSGPVDPYNLLVDQKLDMLRPPIKDSINMDDPYNYRGGQGELDPNYLQRAFTHTGVLQIISQRSRPTAYEGQLTNNHNIPVNPMDVQPGIIDLKITKVGTLWRKAMKKKKARSPWQEWGAILTGSQLFLFKNAHWAKGLVHQFMAQQKHGHPRIPVVFKPPLQDFKPDALIKTDNAVALVDATYTRHKHAFTFVRPGGQEEVLLADNESELNDWLALINYAAAFRAAGVRIRGMVGGTEEDLRARDVRRLDSTQSSQSALSPATAQNPGGELAIQNRNLSPQLQRQVMAARRQIVVQKIGEAKKEITEASKQLDNMLRNARHLLVLAPIAPKTREEIIHSAARADAAIEWTRRDIWRMKCHKDILAMDVQQDGVSAPELEALAEQHSDAPESAKKNRIKGLSRLNSKASAARSPPQSPTSPTRSGRPSTTGSIETYIGNDIFRTPPESATMQRDGDAWRLPPLQLDVRPQEQHRGSVTSTLLSASSPGRASLSHASSTSSVRPPMIEHAITADLSDGTSRGRVTPSPSVEDREAEMLARTLSSEKMEPVSSRSMNLNLDGTAPTSTPESKHRNGVRRSLQKLPKAHNHPSTVHKHKKGKESDGTIRSGGPTAEVEEHQDATPRLQREKGRFILHGKQASVIQFGSEWPNERMRLRREQWRQNSTSPREERTPRAFSYSQHDVSVRPEAASPMVQDFHHGGDSDDEGVGSAGTRHSHGFREDAVAAQLFAETTASPTALESASEWEGAGESAGYFDIGTSFDSSHRRAKRETVIGPKARGVRKGSLQKGGDGNIVTDEDTADDDDTPTARKGDRRTVIGPSIRLNGSSANGGAEEADDGDEDDLVDPISDEELRQLSMPVR